VIGCSYVDWKYFLLRKLEIFSFLGWEYLCTEGLKMQPTVILGTKGNFPKNEA
jgi:hypothetical protein